MYICERIGRQYIYIYIYEVGKMRKRNKKKENWRQSNVSVRRAIGF